MRFAATRRSCFDTENQGDELFLAVAEVRGAGGGQPDRKQERRSGRGSADRHSHGGSTSHRPDQVVALSPFPSLNPLLVSAHSFTTTNHESKMGIMDHFHHESAEAKDAHFIEHMDPSDDKHKAKLSHEVSSVDDYYVSEKQLLMKLYSLADDCRSCVVHGRKGSPLRVARPPPPCPSAPS